MHAVLLAILFGATFTIGMWLCGPPLFRWMGGQGDAHGNAVLYANLIFISAVPSWISSLLAAALRGAGNVRVPATVTAVGSVITLALSPALIFGWGIAPRLGVAGAGVAVGCFNLKSC